jgi:hypothetical protein
MMRAVVGAACADFYSLEEKTALGQLLKFGTQLSGYALI